MSGMRKYMTNLFSSTLQKDDLVMSRIAATMDDFNFAPRRELGVSSLDVAFKLHGATIMFYNFDKNFLTSALACKDKFKGEKKIIINFNWIQCSCYESGISSRFIFQYSTLRYNGRSTLHSTQWIGYPGFVHLQCPDPHLFERIDSENQTSRNSWSPDQPQFIVWIFSIISLFDRLT